MNIVFFIILLVGIIVGWILVNNCLIMQSPQNLQSIESHLETLRKKRKSSRILDNSPAVILIHTFDGYRRYWPGWFHFFFKYYTPEWPVYFANEELDIFSYGHPVNHIKTGKGRWGERLIKALQQIPTEYEYVLYMQEDMWLTAPLYHQHLEQALHFLKKHNWLTVKLQKDCHHQVGLGPQYNNPQWYIASHQPAIWRKSFLLNSLSRHISPGRHEITLNHHLHTDPDLAAKCQCMLDFRLPPFPYEDVSRRGQLRDIGKKMLAREGMKFSVDADEIFCRPD